MDYLFPIRYRQERGGRKKDSCSFEFGASGVVSYVVTELIRERRFIERKPRLDTISSGFIYSFIGSEGRAWGSRQKARGNLAGYTSGNKEDIFIIGASD